MNPAAESYGEGSGSGNNVDDSEPPSTMRGGGGGNHQRTPASAGAAVGGTQTQARGGQGVYGREEVSALKGIFNLYDAENTGTIGVQELEGILQKVGHNPGERRRVHAAVVLTEAYRCAITAKTRLKEWVVA